MLQELDKARAAGQQLLGRDGAAAVMQPSRPLPSLQALFATPVEPPDEEEGEGDDEDDIGYLVER